MYEQLLLLGQAKQLISEYQILIRELGFEEIRKSKFSTLPSRYNCIWLCRKDQIVYWSKKLGTENYEIYKVKIYGKPFKSRESLISLPSDSYLSICKKAEKYWQYNDKFDCEDDEYLYEGKFQIIAHIKL